MQRFSYPGPRIVGSLAGLLFVGLIATVAMTGCSELRKLTYPKDFVYVEKKDLDNAMLKMYDALDRLNTLLGDAAKPDPQRQKEVVAQLQELKRLASSIRGNGEVTNHMLLDEHMDEFLNAIEDARLFASDQSPNYYYAGRLAGNCTGCHRYR